MEEACYNSTSKAIVNHWGGGRRKSLAMDTMADMKSGNEIGSTTNSQGNSSNAMELLNRFESPSSKAAWLSFFSMVEDINEAHSRTLDYYVDEIFNRLDVVFRQVDIWKWSVLLFLIIFLLF